MMGTNEVMIANNPNSAGEKILAKTGYAIIGNALCYSGSDGYDKCIFLLTGYYLAY